MTVLWKVEQGHYFDSFVLPSMGTPFCCSILEDRDSSKNTSDFQPREWLRFEALQFGMQHLTLKFLTASFWSCPIWFRLIQEGCASKIYSVSCTRLVPKLFAYAFCLIKDKQNFQINWFPKAGKSHFKSTSKWSQLFSVHWNTKNLSIHW